MIGGGTRENMPTLNKILKRITPPNPMLQLILQLRNRLPDNIRQEIDQAGPRLHLRPVGREREPVLGHLQQRDAQGPDIRRDGVGLALDALGRHVVRRPDEGIGVALGAEFPAHAEIAQFDLSVAAQEDVRGLDV